MAFDFKKSNQFVIASTAEMTLKDPVTGVDLADENDQAIVFTLVSTSNPKHRKAVQKMLKAREKFGKREPTLEESKEISVNFLVDLSVSVQGMEWDGNKIDNPEVFKLMYNDDEFSWIRDQVGAALGDQTLFIKA